MITPPIRDVSDVEYLNLRTDWAVMLREHLVSNKSYPDLAASFGVPIGTVKSRINRARAKIAALRAAENGSAA